MSKSSKTLDLPSTFGFKDKPITLHPVIELTNAQRTLQWKLIPDWYLYAEPPFKLSPSAPSTDRSHLRFTSARQVVTEPLSWTGYPHQDNDYVDYVWFDSNYPSDITSHPAVEVLNKPNDANKVVLYEFYFDFFFEPKKIPVNFELGGLNFRNHESEKSVPTIHRKLSKTTRSLSIKVQPDSATNFHWLYLRQTDSPAPQAGMGWAFRYVKVFTLKIDAFL